MTAIIIFIFILSLFYLCDRIKNKEYYKLCDKFPGPFAIPVIGNTKDFPMDSHGIFKTVLRFSEQYGRFFRLWNGGKFYLMTKDYKDAEVILGSNVQLKKSESYRFIRPWIGDGVLTSTGDEWRKQRKMITPAFHFKILHDFLEVFNRKATILKEILAQYAGGEAFDVFPHIKLFALDNIYETAMGINMDVQKNSDAEYVKAVEEMCHISIQRMYKFWLMTDPLFRMSSYGKAQTKVLNILHKTTEETIKRKLQSNKTKIKVEEAEIDNFSENTNKRRALLDLLLQSSGINFFNSKEMREEVDTFLFAGHDTVSSGVAFLLYALGDNQEVQELAYQEQLEIFGDSDRSPTSDEIQEMKYLDRVVKESQRFYPSVPIIARELEDDFGLPGNVVVPKGTQLNIIIYAIHRDPRIWNDPDTFNPDNFLPEAIQKRPPYSYIPFSAGPRNCIGQKYAMLEIKSTVSILLRNFKILPSLSAKHRVKLAGEITLVSKNGVHIKIEKRR